ncbi:hypothetical protein CMI40_00965 [Candidatus Pacearchaeota archaeon]|nr:hypothetical protein [Candidatus Pacearchaeota archaeon]|tara:strand:- start:3057 stop:3764 length:708 start_codon:yes stop_codon:yes gene_type:complete
MKKDVIKSQKELKIISINNKWIFTKAKFGPSKPTRIPLLIDEELAFFVAAIIGDGHLRKNKLQISIEISNKKLLESIKKMCKKLFNRKFNIHKIKKREGKKQTYNLIIDSKAIYNLLNIVFKIKKGKKSNIVKVPKIILKSNKSIKASFLIGIMMTEGGKRRRGIGLSTSSKQLWKDLIKIFSDIGIKVLKDKWIYKKYKKEYYGISFKREFLYIIMRECQSGQMGQILDSYFLK